MRSFITVIMSSSEHHLQTLTLRTVSNIELLHGFGLQLMASPSLSLLQILTALDRDGYCRKHKLRHKLEQAINLMSGSSWGWWRIGRDGRGSVQGVWGGLRLNWWRPADRPMLEHPQLVLAEGEAKHWTINSNETTAQHTKPNVFSGPDPVFPNGLTP